MRTRTRSRPERSFFGLTDTSRVHLLQEIRAVIRYYGLGYEEVRRMPVFVRHWFVDEIRNDIKNREKTAETDSQWGVDMDTPISQIMKTNS